MGRRKLLQMYLENYMRDTFHREVHRYFLFISSIKNFSDSQFHEYFISVSIMFLISSHKWYIHPEISCTLYWHYSIQILVWVSWDFFSQDALLKILVLHKENQTKIKQEMQIFSETYTKNTKTKRKSKKKTPYTNYHYFLLNSICIMFQGLLNIFWNEWYLFPFEYLSEKI